MEGSIVQLIVQFFYYTRENNERKFRKKIKNKHNFDKNSEEENQITDQN